MINRFKKYTTPIRYLVIFKLMKYLTPIMYDKFIILNNTWNSYHHIGGKLDTISKTPRPSILFMKKYFNNKKVSGLELGIQKGLNSISILKELNIKTLYLVDAWNLYIENEITKESQNKNYFSVLRKFKNNNKVKIIKGFSKDVVKDFSNNSLDFIYIDANHTYRYVYQDIDLWSKKVKDNGIISGHDILNFNDVLYAVKNWCIKNQYNFSIRPPDWYIIKKGIISCKRCGYYNKEVNICVYENIELDNNFNPCICFIPIINYNERIKLIK